MKKITLIDPSLNAFGNGTANNLGDEIIFRAIQKNFLQEYSHIEVNRVTAHRSLNNEELKEANTSDLIFFGGTNVVSMDVCHKSKWLPSRKKFYYLRPGLRNLVFLGVGLNQYINPLEIKWQCRIRTRLFYKNILSQNFLHSVRDKHTLEALQLMGIDNVIFTACPTLWGFNNQIELNLEKEVKHCLFSITDYSQDKLRDNLMIQYLLDFFGELHFFPQGNEDMDYLYSLEKYTLNKTKIHILPRSLNELENYIASKDFIYVGTRLHLGIFLMERKVKALIIAIDNRAMEMKKSVGIPAIDPGEMNLMVEWLKGNRIFGSLNIPFDNIKRWKEQFKKL